MEIHIVQPWKPPQSFWKIKFDPQSRSQKLRFFSAIHRDFFWEFLRRPGQCLEASPTFGCFTVQSGPQRRVLCAGRHA